MKGKYSNIPMKSTRKYENILINRTDLEEAVLLQPMDETGTAIKTSSVTPNPVHPNGKCIYHVYF